jgi:hypothetical protein
MRFNPLFISGDLDWDEKHMDWTTRISASVFLVMTKESTRNTATGYTLYFRNHETENPRFTILTTFRLYSFRDYVGQRVDRLDIGYIIWDSTGLVDLR